MAPRITLFHLKTRRAASCSSSQEQEIITLPRGGENRKKTHFLPSARVSEEIPHRRPRENGKENREEKPFGATMGNNASAARCWAGSEAQRPGRRAAGMGYRVGCNAERARTLHALRGGLQEALFAGSGLQVAGRGRGASGRASSDESPRWYRCG